MRVGKVYEEAGPTRGVAEPEAVVAGGEGGARLGRDLRGSTTGVNTLLIQHYGFRSSAHTPFDPGRRVLHLHRYPQAPPRRVMGGLYLEFENELGKGARFHRCGARSGDIPPSGTCAEM